MDNNIEQVVEHTRLVFEREPNIELLQRHPDINRVTGYSLDPVGVGLWHVYVVLESN